MSDIGLAFLLLAEGRTPCGTEVVTRPASDTVSDVLVGIDALGHRHLLIKSQEPMPPEQSSAVLVLDTRTLVRQGHQATYLDLYCTDSQLALVFERLVADVVARLEANEAPVTAVRDAVDDWRSLFRQAHMGLTPDQIAGLLGELEILQRLATVHGPSHALDCWWGPTKHVHDFYAPSGRAIEVKTTRSVEGQGVHISNIAQLELGDVATLHMAVIHLRADRQRPALADRVAQLLNLGFPAAPFLSLLEEAGYVHGTSVFENTRYRVENVRWWEVTDDFPGIRRDRIKNSHLKGVTGVKYELSLDALPQHLGPAGETEAITGMGAPS